jgi:hypothetical protein
LKIEWKICGEENPMDTNRRLFLCNAGALASFVALSGVLAVTVLAKAEDREHERGEKRYPRIQASIDALRDTPAPSWRQRRTISTDTKRQRCMLWTRL